MCHQVVATPRARGLTATRPTTSARVRWRWRKATPAVNRPNPSPSLAKRVSVRPPVDQISMRSVCKHLVIKCHVEARSISADLTLKWFNGWQRCNIFSLWSIQSVIFLVGCQYWVWRQKDSGRGTRCSAELDWPDPVPRWGARRSFTEEMKQPCIQSGRMAQWWHSQRFHSGGRLNPARKSCNKIPAAGQKSFQWLTFDQSKCDDRWQAISAVCRQSGNIDQWLRSQNGRNRSQTVEKVLLQRQSSCFKCQVKENRCSLCRRCYSS